MLTKKRLKDALTALIGDPQIYLLEHRVLYILATTIEIALVVGIIINLVIFRYTIAVTHTTILLAIITAHYLAKKYRWEKSIAAIFSLLFILIILPTYWFLSGGTVGPIPWFLPLFLFTFLFIIRGTLRIILTSIFFLTVTALIVVEKNMPAMMSHLQGNLPSTFEPLSALFFSFIMYILLFGFVIHQYDKELIARLKAIAVADKANQSKSIFLSSMSHELRNPLSSIIGFSQLLEEEISDPEHQEYITMIKKGGEYLLELINDVLDLSRIEAGEVKTSIENMAIEPLLVDLFKIILPLAEKNNISITRNKLETLNLFVMADKTRLKQVLLNLFSNAIKYNKKNGKVALEIELKSSDKARFNISDTGVGIAAEKQKDLFVPFNRLGAENTAIEGTGIGLVITQKLIKEMGGDLGFQSEEGIGSTFWVELPISIETNTTNVEAQQQEFSINQFLANDTIEQYSILYIEDNVVNIRLIENIFNRISSIKLLTALTGEAGLNMIFHNKPNLILLDINLPGINGFKVLEKIRNNPETHDIPVIALTANATTTDIEKGLDAGFDRYHTKPFKVNILLADIEILLKNITS